MKRIYLIITISVLAFSMVLTSCSKDDNDSPQVVAKTKIELITSAPWTLTKAVYSPDYNGVTDVYQFMEDCDKDNTMKFNTDKTVVLDEGAVKCDADDPQTENGTWAFSSDETKIVAGDNELEISTLTETMLEVKMPTVEAGVTYVLTMTYKH